MEVVATISTRLFCLSVELGNKDSSSIPAWWVPLLPALLASLLHATVIWPLAVATRHWFGGQTCSTWLRVLSKVTNEVQVGTLLAMLRLLLNNTARLLLRLVTGLRVSAASTDEDEAAAAADRRQPGVREDGPRRSARHRRPSVRVAGPEWDKRLRG
ncbi:unnamed protein product [Miscanthus lutarioriparius]|uniref:Uncharacterized protein n=1 Tax=Miscanthus lutarioriparius TaxID=422564 RepID=A0A811PHE2_9POAL|nr:unnamed protein product [Miscanthus lutarioriparius]